MSVAKGRVSKSRREQGDAKTVPVPSSEEPKRKDRTNPEAELDLPPAKLVATIETEVIPRLVLAQRGEPPVAMVRAMDGWIPGDEDVAAFAKLVMTNDARVAISYLEAMRARKTSVETLYLKLLAPTAEFLGRLWEEDLSTFAEVTLGVGRLQQALRELGAGHCSEIDQGYRERRILLETAEGEQHSFGLLMVGEFFRRAGWSVWDEPLSNVPSMARLVRNEWFDVVGLSVSGDVRMETLASTIRLIRRSSRNRGVGIMVGGRVFNEHPELVPLVGADATASDARQAVRQAEQMAALLM